MVLAANGGSGMCTEVDASSSRESIEVKESGP